MQGKKKTKTKTIKVPDLEPKKDVKAGYVTPPPGHGLPPPPRP
jgi:hypothetical protein